MIQKKLQNLLKLYKRGGIKLIFIVLSKKVFLSSKVSIPSLPYIKNFEVYHNLLYNKIGLEVGGPSNIFETNSIIPIYPLAKRVDGCNFSTKTVWEGELQEGWNYLYDNKSRLGFQYIQEASELSTIPDKKYDFILSSHSIEHIANPLRALQNWLRVLKNKGVLLMVVPHKEGTFDHNRPVTKFNHLLDDFKKDIKEDDLTHLEEILELHDLSMDPLAGTKENFYQRSLHNYENRCLHHHVFNAPLVIEICTYCNIQIEAIDLIHPIHIVVIGKKSKKVDNTAFLTYVKQHSPFTSDKE